MWGLPTQKGTTLYLCLEDTLRRVQDRLNRITEEVPGNAYFSAQAETMAGGLLEEIRRSEAIRYVRQALEVNPYIVQVDAIAVDFSGSVLSLTCQIQTIYGEVEINGWTL